MKRRFSTKLFLWVTDLFSWLRGNRKAILAYLLVLFLGVGFGVYVGSRLGKSETPYCYFACIFRGYYEPFRFLLPELLRFSLFALIASLANYLPFYLIYPSFSLFFFGKHFGELACITFLTDALTSAILTLFLVVLPLALLGTFLFIRIALRAERSRLAKGGIVCRCELKSTGAFLLCEILLYALFLFAIYVILCGTIYLLMIAL